MLAAAWRQVTAAGAVLCVRVLQRGLLCPALYGPTTLGHAGIILLACHLWLRLNCRLRL